MSRKAPANQSNELTPEDLARRWRGKVSLGTLRNWRSLRRGPPFHRTRHGRVLYHLAAVEAFEALHRFRKSPTTT